MRTSPMNRSAALSTACILLAAASGRAQCLQQWTGDLGIPAGIPGLIYALTTWDPDGAGPTMPQLVAAGAFGSAGGVPANKIARWDGVTWHPFADGIGTNSAVSIFCLTNFDPDGAGPTPPQLIAGGHFSVGGNFISRWDTAAGAWMPLSTGMNNDVHAMTSWDPDGAGPFPPQLVAVGEFTVAGGVPCLRVARWDGANWQPLTSGLNNIATAVTTLDPDGAGPLPDVLVAGGAFTLAGGVAATRIARFDGTTWAPFGTGMNSTVWAFSSWDAGAGPQLVAAGDFTTANGVAANRIARFNGTTWLPFGAGFNGSVRAMNTWDPDGPGPAPLQFLAMGLFTLAEGNPIARLAHWDGSSWQGFGAGVNGSFVNSTANFDPDGPGPAYPQLAVGGDFTLAAGNLADSIAAWVSAPTPVVITAPRSVGSCPGGQASFAVRAAAGAFPTYQWRRAGVNLSNGTTPWGSMISGATSISLAVSNITSDDAGQYDVIVTNSCGSITSNPATLSFCYANCDCSTTSPALNVNDFVCFQTRFAAGSPLANCDGSTSSPSLNVLDFVCFQSRFAAGCP